MKKLSTLSKKTTRVSSNFLEIQKQCDDILCSSLITQYDEIYDSRDEYLGRRTA